MLREAAERRTRRSSAAAAGRTSGASTPRPGDACFVRSGTLRRSASGEADVHIFTRSKLPWLASRRTRGHSSRLQDRRGLVGRQQAAACAGPGGGERRRGKGARRPTSLAGTRAPGAGLGLEKLAIGVRGARSLVPPIARPGARARGGASGFVCRAGTLGSPYQSDTARVDRDRPPRSLRLPRRRDRAHARLYEGWLLLAARRTEFEFSHEHDGGDDARRSSCRPTSSRRSPRGPGCGGTIFDVPVRRRTRAPAALIERSTTRPRHGDPDELALRVAHAVVSRCARGAETSP